MPWRKRFFKIMCRSFRRRLAGGVAAGRAYTHPARRLFPVPAPKVISA
jgi:hypothetical protein